MWKILFGKGKECWRQMNFSRKVIKIFGEMKRMDFDRNIVHFLDRCSLSNHIQLSISFSNVYGSLQDFFVANQGKGITVQKI